MALSILRYAVSHGKWMENPLTPYLVWNQSEALWSSGQIWLAIVWRDLQFFRNLDKTENQWAKAMREIETSGMWIDLNVSNSYVIGFKTKNKQANNRRTRASLTKLKCSWSLLGTLHGCHETMNHDRNQTEICTTHRRMDWATQKLYVDQAESQHLLAKSNAIHLLPPSFDGHNCLRRFCAPLSRWNTDFLFS